MKSDVCIIDYGIGNLYSVRRAFEYCGATVNISNNPDEILSAPRLVLPGVGAFADGMQGLIDRNLHTVIMEFAASGKPLLGICLGMQMLATFSEEFGMHNGLDIIPGKVLSIPRQDSNSYPIKVPNVGWIDLQSDDHSERWKDTILHGITLGEAVYITHSFAVHPVDTKNLLSYYSYSDIKIAAAIKRNNVYGVQFHPEKSGPAGLKIINNFKNINYNS